MSDNPEVQSDSGDGNIKHLRDRAKQAGELETQLQETQARLAEVEASAKENQRKAAFLEAGISPEDPKVKYFYQGYSGELDPEAIKAEAATIGLSQPVSQTPDTGASIDAAMQTGAPAPVSEVASDHVKALERLGAATSKWEWDQALGALSQMNPPDGQLAAELGGGFKDPAMRDVGNQPKLYPVRGMSQ